MSDTKNNLHCNHRERVKNRFLNNGLKSFDDHNVLELLLFYSIPQRDTNETAHNLINEFGSLSAVFDAPFEALANISGVGDNTATLIKLMPELFSRYEQDKLNNNDIILNSADSAGKYFISRFIGVNTEKLFVVCMDNRCKINKFVCASSGGISYTDLNIRQIAAAAINSNSSAVIIAHNHPSGVAAPSANDVDSTRTLIMTLKKLDIRVNDHIIVSGKDYYSMANSNKFKYMFE